MDFSPASPVLGGAFALCVFLGAALAASGFCTMGAISDLVLTGDGRRLHAWRWAMVTAAVGVMLLTWLTDFAASAARIPYADASLDWGRSVVGGLLFGAGMVAGGGCVSRNVVRLGLGDLNSAVTLAATALSAWWLVWRGGYGAVIGPLLDGMTVNVAMLGSTDQRLPSVLAGFGMPRTPAETAVILALILWLVVRGRASQGIRLSRALYVAGIGMGVVVTALWWLISGPTGQRWIQEAEFALTSPPGTGVQALTFIRPLADSINYLRSPSISNITFGMSTLIGTLTGAMAYALYRGRLQVLKLRPGLFVRNVAAGILLGTGGVTAMGCSIGQGITGISTLALGSMIAVLSMIAGCAFAVALTYQWSLHSDGGRWRKAARNALTDILIALKSV
ncbi:MAG: YeeE/YedE family protein [Gammaproteobacteria bacterium]|nr:YeeE/YedE family protein [Gammaproteobacteria bacterium]